MAEHSRGSADMSGGGNQAQNLSPEPIQVSAEIAQVLNTFEASLVVGNVNLPSRLGIEDIIARVRSDIRKRREFLD